MHRPTGIFNGPVSTQVSSEADLVDGQFLECIENTLFYDCTWLDAYLELEQYLGSD